MHVLRASNEHNDLNGLISGIPDAIAIVDLRGRVRKFLNAGALLSEDGSPAKIENTEPKEHLAPEVAAELRRLIAKAVEGLVAILAEVPGLDQGMAKEL